MDYSIDYVREHLPREDPPFEQVPRDVVNEIARWSDTFREDDGDRALTARATRWTYAVFEELSLGRFAFDSMFFRYWPDGLWPFTGILAQNVDGVSFGLFDEKSEATGLGIIMDVPHWPGPSFVVVDYLAFPRLNNQKFPLAVRQSEVNLHVAHPHGATGACWAKCNQDSSVWGVLTAGHAVSTRPGGSVAMAVGSAASVARTYYQPVDAAFVKTAAPSRSPAQLGVLSFPALSMPATVHCQGGNTARTVVEVTSNCGVTHTRKIGMRIYLDKPESAGDSGALVTVATGDAIGIYTGSLNVPGPPPGVRGHAQNFEQAVYALDVTPYL
jgi:hypothetical protein